MKTNSNRKGLLTSIGKYAMLGVLGLVISSCDPTLDAFSYDLPEANSKEDQTPPAASFTATETANYLEYEFSNTSSSATDYVWDFGDGNTATSLDGFNAYPDEGVYTVTLTATDKLGKSDTFSMEIEVVEPEVPAAIIPDILNGDFNDGQDFWKSESFTGGNTNPFNSSSDGSPLNYDGSDNGSKTPGAKWTQSTSAGAYLSSSTRYAYQSITVTPNTPYVLEYEYAIKTPDEQDGIAPGGNRIIGEILPGHFTDGADAVVVSNEGPLTQIIGSEINGKGNFVVAKSVFTSNATGEISIWIYAVTDVDAYVDNVKVYPVN
ncbi:PKD domain-containing protein [Formosa sp. A9]|uniref:PKD domain-containing protein n=1 Tax=Formosa sp. A9 TaxID=3442641 RepID=UPI003EB6CB79